MSKINMKMEELFKEDFKNKSGVSVLSKPVGELINKYKLGNTLKAKDFEGFEVGEDEELSLMEESTINEKIIELLTEKIISEKENRLQTEIQIDKLSNQNKKQINALQQMLKNN